MHIAHRDLKPDNIMVDVSNPANPVTKIIDFVFSA
jgi:serine/threonine protein kinase